MWAKVLTDVKMECRFSKFKSFESDFLKIENSLIFEEYIHLHFSSFGPCNQYLISWGKKLDLKFSVITIPKYFFC